MWASGVVRRLAEPEFIEDLTREPDERALLAATAYRLTFA